MPTPHRAYRAGESLEDFCRACKTDRMHTVIAANADGLPIRVACGYCRSEHNYRGGARIGVEAGSPAFARAAAAFAARASADRSAGKPIDSRTQGPRSSANPFPIVS